MSGILSDEEEGFIPPKTVTREQVVEEETVPESFVVDNPVYAEDSQEEQEATVTKLSEEELKWLKTFMTVGRAEKTIDILGHSVRIQTLTGGDELRVGLYEKDHIGSNFYARAHQIGYCAAGIIDVDGKCIGSTPLSEKPEKYSLFLEKAEVIEEHYPLVITMAYEAIVDLTKEFIDKMIKLGKLKG